MRHHVVHFDQDPHGHFYEEQDLSSSPVAQRGLIRITVCKVIDDERLQTLLRDLPVREEDPTFTCLTWVREAFCKLHEDGKAVKSYLRAEDWNSVETCARTYCKRKRDLGRFHDGNVAVDNNGAPPMWDVKKISTFNYWENREITP